MTDVKRKTVDEVTRRVIEQARKGGRDVSVEKAKQVVVDAAERVNRERRGEK
jgi:reverse gyrase